MNMLSRSLAALAACAACSTASAASNSSQDYSDLWWNPDESGWGAHVTLQGDIVFMVLYVYDAAGQPRFFVAPSTQLVDFSAFPPNTYVGPLYATEGPAFAGAFDPARVTSREVGTARVSFAGTTANLTYTVSGATVAKTITRQGWRAPDITGEFKGGLFATATAATCPLGLPSLAYPGSFRVSRAGETVTIDSTFSPGFTEQGTCRYSGSATQAGSQLSIAGTYACEFSNTNTASGTFELTAVEAGPNGFSGRYRATEGAACQHTGYFGGMKRGYDTLPDPREPEAAP